MGTIPTLIIKLNTKKKEEPVSDITGSGTSFFVVGRRIVNGGHLFQTKTESLLQGWITSGVTL